MEIKKIKVIVKKPGRDPESINVWNVLNEFQKIVGGYIETVGLTNDSCIICNEEGRLMNLRHNCEVCGVDFVGPIIFAGVKDGEFTDFPAEFSEFRNILFPDLFK